MAEDTVEFFTGSQLNDGQLLPSFKRFLDKELQKHMKLNRNDVSDPREYDFRHDVRGIAVVISNENFNSECGSSIESREYAKEELRKMNEMFSRLGFIVMLFKDLKAQQMEEVIQTVTSEEMNFFLEKSDAFACVLASHGNEIQEENPTNPNVKVYHHVIYGTDHEIKTHLLMDLLKGNRCRQLRGKPKLFFIQACRSRFSSDQSRFDEGVEIDDICEDPNVFERCLNWLRKRVCRKRPTMVPTTVMTPCHNDFLVMYSTSQGKAGYGREGEGGWLLHVMHEIMAEHIQRIRQHNDNYLDFLLVMTEVMGHICVHFESITENPTTSGMKTAPTLQHKLSNDLIFRNKYLF